MIDTDVKQVLSRLPSDEFFNREAELERLCLLATSQRPDRGEGARSAGTLGEGAAARREAKALLLGAPRTGKTELLRKTFDRLFCQSSETAPFYYALRAQDLDAWEFARDYLAQFLSQFIAFRRKD